MTEELLKRMRNCPFCGSDHTNGWTWISQLKDGSYILHHYCHPEIEGVVTTISVYGSTAEEAVERWNADGKEHLAG